jgi:hypothetical protein
MKSASAGAASGCIVWFLVFGILFLCLCPTSMFVGGFSATAQSDFVARTLGPYLCPEGSTAEIITFATTSTDEFGNQHPATGYAMQCVDASGVIVRESSPDYAFYWLGLLVVGSLVLSALLAFLFAAPDGALVSVLVNRFLKANATRQ